MSLFLCFMLALYPAPEAPTDAVGALKGTWAIVANGHPGQLIIELDKFDRIGGTMYGNPISGTYDPKTRQIVIKRMIPQNKGEMTVAQEFTGVLSEAANTKPLRYVFKGTFKSDIGGGWGQPNVRYDWNATNTPVLKP